MGNLFANLPVPTSNAAGAAVDVSAMGATKTIVVGGPFQGTVTIEYSNDDGAAVWAPVPNSSFVNQPGRVTIDLAVKWMRAVMDAYKGGSANADVGAPAAQADFAAIGVAPVDISTMSSFKTVVSPAANIVEISEDGISWSQAFAFQNGGGQSAVLVGKLARCLTGMVWMGASPTGDGGSDVEYPEPFTSPDENVIIYARATGSNTTGDGKTIPTAYRTLQRATLDIPLHTQGGVVYTIDHTGIGQETLPDGYELPAWKSPAGFWADASDPYFPIRTAVNLRADPQLTTALPASEAVIEEADLVPTVVGGVIADVAGFNDVRNSGTGDGAGDAFTDEGGGIAKLTIAGEEFDGDVAFITIMGSPSLANDGTFPVVGTDGDQVFYQNPAVVAEAAFAGTYETFTPFVYVETTVDHGLWQNEFPVQVVTIAAVGGTIGPVANGDHTMIWRTKNTFIFAVDDPTVATLLYGGGGTVSVLFVQDPTSGNVQIRTTKNFGADDSLVGKLLISSFSEFWNAVVYHNTGGVPGGDTLFLTHCFAPGSFDTPIGGPFQIMEQSAELLTTCTFESSGERRGPHRGGLTIANCDSISLNGTKVTPLNEGEIGLCQVGGTLITAGCHLTTSRFNDAQGAAMSQYSYLDNMLWKGSAVDLERCLARNQPDPFLGGPVNWFYAYFGTVFNNMNLGYDGSVEQDLFACKFYQGNSSTAFFSGRNTWNQVSGEDIDGFFVGASGQAARNRMRVCNATSVSGDPQVLAVNGGMFLINSDIAPYGDASFTNPGDFMIVDGLPERTFDDFRQHALLDLTPLTANFDSVFEAIWPYTSSSIPFFGDPPYPSISVTGRAPDAGGVIITYNPVTGLVDISYETGVSTVLDAETAVDAFAWPDAGGIRTKTPGTPGNVLTSPVDNLAATLLDVGVNGPCGEYTNLRQNPKTGLLDCPGPLGTQSTVLAYSLS